MYHFPTIDMGYTSLMHILLVITDNKTIKVPQVITFT